MIYCQGIGKGAVDMFEEAGKDLVLSSLDHQKILRAMNISRGMDPDGQDPELYSQLEEQILRCESEVLRCLDPRAVCRVLPVSEISPLLAGKDIRRLLDGCDEAVLVALTLGAALERRLMKEEVTDISNAFLMDVCASQAAEEAADLYERRLSEEVRLAGKYLTNRYSPGYGDLPLEVQKPLLEYLNAGRAIGLTLTATNLMVPRKSVTAILGISDRPRPLVLGGCSHCPLLTKCSWRERGERCYEEKKDQSL